MPSLWQRVKGWWKPKPPQSVAEAAPFCHHCGAKNLNAYRIYPSGRRLCIHCADRLHR